MTYETNVIRSDFYDIFMVTFDVLTTQCAKVHMTCNGYNKKGPIMAILGTVLQRYSEPI